MSWTDADLFNLTRNTSFWTPAGDWSDSRAHLLILYTIAKNVNWLHPDWPAPLRPPLCVEIGVREGPTTMAILHAMRETGGKLISLECDEGCAAITRGLVEKAGLSAWWQLEVRRSEAFAAECPAPIDFLWIDGDHGEQQVRLDVAGYVPKVRPNGIIAFHDFFSDPACMAPPVAGAFPSFVSVCVEELRMTGDFEVIVLPWSYGLVLARRLR